MGSCIIVHAGDIHSSCNNDCSNSPVFGHNRGWIHAYFFIVACPVGGFILVVCLIICFIIVFVYFVFLCRKYHNLYHRHNSQCNHELGRGGNKFLHHHVCNPLRHVVRFAHLGDFDCVHVSALDDKQHPAHCHYGQQ